MNDLNLSKHAAKQVQKVINSMPIVEKQQCINLIRGMSPRLEVMSKQTGKDWFELISDFSLIMLCFADCKTIDEIPDIPVDDED